jgi:hypothetical protein
MRDIETFNAMKKVIEKEMEAELETRILKEDS